MNKEAQLLYDRILALISDRRRESAGELIKAASSEQLLEIRRGTKRGFFGHLANIYSVGGVDDMKDTCVTFGKTLLSPRGAMNSFDAASKKRCPSVGEKTNKGRAKAEV
jgi:hypothetical protein